MDFNVAVKADARGRLKGTYQARDAANGMHLMRKRQDVLVIPRQVDARHDGGSRVAIWMPDGTQVVLVVTKFPAYQGRLAAAVAAFLRGDRRDLGDGGEFKLEPWLLVPAVAPFGVLIVTRGGAIWGALGGIVAVGCLAVAQAESLPKAARVALMLLVNVVLYGTLIALVANASGAGR